MSWMGAQCDRDGALASIGHLQSFANDGFPPNQPRHRTMVPSHDPIEACPRCKSAECVKPKLLLLERGDPARVGDNQRSWNSHLAFSTTDLRPELAEPGAVGQFIPGLYCDQCGVGFVPESMAKRPQPEYMPVTDGFRRVYEDGALGPLLQRMVDDPDREASEVRLSRGTTSAENDHVKVSRAGGELLERHGRNAYIVAAELAGSAMAEGDFGSMQFWLAVSSSIQPR